MHDILYASPLACLSPAPCMPWSRLLWVHALLRTNFCIPLVNKGTQFWPSKQAHLACVCRPQVHAAVQAHSQQVLCTPVHQVEVKVISQRRSIQHLNKSVHTHIRNLHYTPHVGHAAASKQISKSLLSTYLTPCMTRRGGLIDAELTVFQLHLSTTHSVPLRASAACTATASTHVL
jgi:hypothetical protein